MKALEFLTNIGVDPGTPINGTVEVFYKLLIIKSNVHVWLNVSFLEE